MCLAVPGKIKSINENLAKVDIMGIEKSVDIELIENPHVNDYILIHAGFGIEKIDNEYFDYLEKVFQEEVENEQKRNCT
ncbi:MULTISPECIES: HypC/HybG/HupF family hydrogenase formation chaperone [Clostridium]|uniref:HypC/HybG/HupF family hydrogenase formation chaperone n=1 Tax=Clostridium TaxID=1485 RepID=UPI00069CE1BF|nr:HypC/HybG/HupF family hydrogenase formation chaperone [Clostridium sp. DMHC 10]KOF58207.1 hydrogenase assembly protein HypC [Clostridium sp. DMHC 10]MCD2345573.1 HypC/HybG/HupF family hydrogenase formation chaperone [Clostridium guangxiense]